MVARASLLTVASHDWAPVALPPAVSPRTCALGWVCTRTLYPASSLSVVLLLTSRTGTVVQAEVVVVVGTQVVGAVVSILAASVVGVVLGPVRARLCLPWQVRRARLVLFVQMLGRFGIREFVIQGCGLAFLGGRSLG